MPYVAGRQILKVKTAVRRLLSFRVGRYPDVPALGAEGAVGGSSAAQMLGQRLPVPVVHIQDHRSHGCRHDADQIVRVLRQMPAHLGEVRASPVPVFVFRALAAGVCFVVTEHQLCAGLQELVVQV